MLTKVTVVKIVLCLFAVDFHVDVVWFQMFNFTHFIKPYCGVCF